MQQAREAYAAWRRTQSARLVGAATAAAAFAVANKGATPSAAEQRDREELNALRLSEARA